MELFRTFCNLSFKSKQKKSKIDCVQILLSQTIASNHHSHVEKVEKLWQHMESIITRIQTWNLRTRPTASARWRRSCSSWTRRGRRAWTGSARGAWPPFRPGGAGPDRAWPAARGSWAPRTPRAVSPEPSCWPSSTCHRAARSTASCPSWRTAAGPPWAVSATQASKLVAWIRLNRIGAAQFRTLELVDRKCTGAIATEAGRLINLGVQVGNFTTFTNWEKEGADGNFKAAKSCRFYNLSATARKQ